MNDFIFHNLPTSDHKIIQVPTLSIFDPDFQDDEYDESVGSIIARISPLPIYVIADPHPTCRVYKYRIIGGSEFYRAFCSQRCVPDRINVHLCEKEIPKGFKVPTLSEFLQARNIRLETKPT